MWNVIDLWKFILLFNDTHTDFITIRGIRVFLKRRKKVVEFLCLNHIKPVKIYLLSVIVIYRQTDRQIPLMAYLRLLFEEKKNKMISRFCKIKLQKVETTVFSLIAQIKFSKNSSISRLS